MSSPTQEADKDGSLGSRGPIHDAIDACAFPDWPGTPALVEYMEEAWTELLLRPGDHAGPVSVLSPTPYVDPRRRTPADSRTFLREVLKNGTSARVVLGWDEGLRSTVFPYQRIARTVVRAANDWLADTWLRQDSALYGMALVPSSMPDVAAEEIERAGANDRIVAVALGCNGLGRPFGDRIYLPLFEAAVEAGLPVVLQVGSDISADLVTPPVAGGMPATYGELRALGVHSHMSHVASMIAEGLFERFPSLRVMLVGGGFSWLPSWLWRQNLWFKRGRRSQAPWMTRLPSEYFVDHFLVTSESFELNQDPAQTERLLAAIPGLEGIIVYASCFPHVGLTTPADVLERLPVDWHSPVLRDNALGFYRWPTRPSDTVPSSSETGTLARGG